MFWQRRRYPILLHRTTFQIQQPPFAFHSTTVARELTVGPDHTVARYDDGERVTSVSETDCPNGGRLVDAPGEFAVRNGDAKRDFFERFPDSALESGTADSITVDADRENRPPTGEVLFELCPGLGEEIIVAMPAVALGL